MDAIDENPAEADKISRSDRSKPVKPLPTDRIAIDTQFSILRGYAAASGTEHKAVSNHDVGKTINMNPNSVSVCNPFWESIGLITREGRQQRPSDEVFDYFQAYQWNPDTAALKLAPVISQAWFCTALVPKLSFRALSKLEAASFLADEAKASKEYRDNLFLLLEYMKQVGIVSIENDTVTLRQDRPAVKTPLGKERNGEEKNKEEEEQEERLPEVGKKVFSVHVPDKKDAVISLPEDIDEDDWNMVLEVIQMYVNRWKKFQPKKY